MYGKSKSFIKEIDPTSAEELADALFEIGDSFLQKKDYLMAAKWLGRAHELINSQELERLTREATELRLAISRAVIHSLIGIHTTNSFQQAEDHVACLESELGDKLLVLLLRLEIIDSAPGEIFDGESYANILRRMFRSMCLSDATFLLAISHIRKLDDKCPTMAVPVLDEFLLDLVIPSQKTEWIDRTVLLRVMLATHRRNSSDVISNLTLTFDRVAERIEKPLSVDPTQAIVTVKSRTFVF